MRRAPKAWTRSAKRRSNTVPKAPPKSREVSVEVLGVAPGLTRIDLVADTHAQTVGEPTEPQEAQPVPEGGRWETIEDALKAAKRPRAPDLWAGPLGPLTT